MKKKIIIITGIVVLLLAGIAAGYGYHAVFLPNTEVRDEGTIYIRKGDSFETVMTLLQSQKYLKNEGTLRMVARLKEYPSLIRPGRYRIKDGMSNNELINMLRSGNQEPVHFTFNNIRTLPDFARLAGQELSVDAAELLRMVADPDTLSRMGFTADNIIGMFIPNTYQIYWDITTGDFLKRMHSEYRKFWNKDRLAKAGKADLSPMDVITLASIVEEETARSEEYPVIAGVYINRLKKGWKLEACPTVKFALGDFTIRRVLEKHIETPSPYNTYLNYGLPPGPIRMPSTQVIEAVLNYQHHDYMFFCAKSDLSGTHHFSRTLQQHLRYGAEYHQVLNQRKIYR